MRRAFLILVLLLVAGVVLAGMTESVGDNPRPIWIKRVADTGITVTEYAGVCGSLPADPSLFADTDGRSRCYIPEGWNAIITQVGGVLTEDVGEKCIFKLSYDIPPIANTTTGDGYVTGADIDTSDATFDCDGTLLDLDAQGEGCRKRVTPIVLLEGSWVHWEVTAGVGGCTAADIDLTVYGEWRKNG